MSAWAWRLAPLLLVAAIFVAVLRRDPPAPFPRTAIPHEPHRADRCTWDCHNHGCRHRSSLPGWLSGDRGLYGWTIGALQAGGRALVPGAPGLGYGAVNLLVFVVVWPGLMYALWLIALRQRRQLRALRGRR